MTNHCRVEWEGLRYVKAALIYFIDIAACMYGMLTQKFFNYTICETKVKLHCNSIIETSLYATF